MHSIIMTFMKFCICIQKTFHEVNSLELQKMYTFSIHTENSHRRRHTVNNARDLCLQYMLEKWVSEWEKSKHAYNNRKSWNVVGLQKKRKNF